MLNSDDEKDINLALRIVNELPSNRNILNKLIPIEDCYDDRVKWYRSNNIITMYFRHDFKGNIPLYFNRHPNE